MKQCEYIEKTPIYITRIGGFQIDPSEYEPGKPGAFFNNKETPCRLVADEGKKYCPRHEAIVGHEAQQLEASSSGASV